MTEPVKDVEDACYAAKRLEKLLAEWPCESKAPPCMKCHSCKAYGEVCELEAWLARVKDVLA